MPILGKLKNIFGGGAANAGDGRKKSRFPLIKQDADPNELWEIVGELGDGAFGKVYKAKLKEKLDFAALKQVDICNETELEDYSVEIDILSQCKHKNVVGLYESYLFGGKLWMFIEFCELGALDSIMLELEKPLTEPQIRYVCKEMCEGLDFLHQNFVIHRDLKAGNVLLTQNGGVRLADFGVSAKNTSVKQKRDSYIGTPYWMAPEVILCETIKDSPYDFKADIWSFGITLIEFSQIEPPNHEMHPMRVVLKIQKSDPPTLRAPHKWSKEFNDFIAKCLVKDPEKRWTTAELLQHPFIKNNKSHVGIADLISELGAEITLEEKDIEEDLDALTDADAGMESDASSLSMVTVDDPARPAIITVDETPKNDKAALCDNKAKEPIKSQDSGKDEKPDVSLPAPTENKPPLVLPPTSTTQTISHIEGDPSDFEGVIFREKKPKPSDGLASKVEQKVSPNKMDREEAEDKTPSPEPKTKELSKKYRSLTKTRKFLVNGEVVTSKVQKVISHDGEEKQKEHKLWKADLRELKMLHRLENRQLQDLEIKSQQAVEEQLKKFEQDELALGSMYEANLDMLSKQHKQQIDKMQSTHYNEKKSLMKKIKTEQEREMKSFMDGLKQDIKWMKQEVEALPKELRKEALQTKKTCKEAEHLDKQRKFVDEQRKQTEKSLMRLEDQQAEQYALSEKQFLQQKQQVLRAREEAFWDMEEKHMAERYQLAEQLLKSKFILKRSLMMQRHSKESDQIKRINNCKEEEQLACHALEWKRLPKILKSDAKTRALMYRESIRISVINLTLDEEKEKIKKFEETEKKRAKDERARLEAKHKRQLADLRSKNSNLLKELEQVHIDKQNMLLENEMQKTAELSKSYMAELNKWKEELEPKKKILKELFTTQLEEQEKLLSVRDYQGALAVTTSASLTPILRPKFPQRVSFFGKFSESVQNEDSGSFAKSSFLRTSKRSSAFGSFAEKLKESSRSSIISQEIDDDVELQQRRHSVQGQEGLTFKTQSDREVVRPNPETVSLKVGLSGGDEFVEGDGQTAARKEKTIILDWDRKEKHLEQAEPAIAASGSDSNPDIRTDASEREMSSDGQDVDILSERHVSALKSQNDDENVSGKPIIIISGVSVDESKAGVKIEEEEEEENLKDNDEDIAEIYLIKEELQETEAIAPKIGSDELMKSASDAILLDKDIKSEREDEVIIASHNANNITSDKVAAISGSVLEEESKSGDIHYCDDDDDDEEEESGLTYDDSDIALEMENPNCKGQSAAVMGVYVESSQSQKLYKSLDETCMASKVTDGHAIGIHPSNPPFDDSSALHDGVADTIELPGEAKGDGMSIHAAAISNVDCTTDSRFSEGDSWNVAKLETLKEHDNADHYKDFVESQQSVEKLDRESVNSEDVPVKDVSSEQQQPALTKNELAGLMLENLEQTAENSPAQVSTTDDLSPGDSKATDSAVEVSSSSPPLSATFSDRETTSPDPVEVRNEGFTESCTIKEQKSWGALPQEIKLETTMLSGSIPIDAELDCKVSSKSNELIKDSDIPAEGMCKQFLEISEGLSKDIATEGDGPIVYPSCEGASPKNLTTSDAASRGGEV